VNFPQDATVSVNNGTVSCDTHVFTGQRATMQLHASIEVIASASACWLL